MSTFLQLLKEGLNRLDVIYRPAPERCTLLESYCAELLKWKEKLNLISKSAGLEEIVEKHFLDSLLLLPELQGGHLLDIGTGAGFPGLVCKAASPELSVSLVEPRQKRVNFLRHITRTLKLKEDTGSIEIYAERMDETSPLCSKHFDYITCRAVDDIDTFFKMTSCFAGSGAAILLMKGPKWQEELDAAKRSISELGYFFKGARDVVLPFSNAKRFILRFEAERK